MNKDVKKMWVDALRSGTYLQGKNYLHRTDGSFCCLGVLCDLYSRHAAPVGWVMTDDGDHYMFGHTQVETYIPQVVADWADLSINSNEVVEVWYDGAKRELVVLNDGDERSGIMSISFAEIADAIEEQL